MDERNAYEKKLLEIIEESDPEKVPIIYLNNSQ